MFEAMVSWAPYKHTERESIPEPNKQDAGGRKEGTVTPLYRDLERLA